MAASRAGTSCRPPNRSCIFRESCGPTLGIAKGLFANSNHRIIRAGVDSTELRKASTFEADHLFKKMGFAEDDFILVNSNAKEQKDPLFHVDILKALHEQDLRYHLVFPDGPLLQAMKTKADELKMARFLHTPDSFLKLRLTYKWQMAF